MRLTWLPWLRSINHALSICGHLFFANDHGTESVCCGNCRILIISPCWFCCWGIAYKPHYDVKQQPKNERSNMCMAELTLVTKEMGGLENILRIPSPSPDLTPPPKSRQHVLFSPGGIFGTPLPAIFLISAFLCATQVDPLTPPHRFYWQKCYRWVI